MLDVAVDDGERVLTARDDGDDGSNALQNLNYLRCTATGDLTDHFPSMGYIPVTSGPSPYLPDARVHTFMGSSTYK